MGAPKALVRGPDGRPWAARACTTLTEGGCNAVLLVVGARADAVRAVAPPGVQVVLAEDWAEGMGASLRTGLVAAGRLEPAPVVAVVLLVDLPGVGPAVVQRLLCTRDHGPTALARATFTGRPAHPVLIGSEHWRGAAASARGDEGARDYLRSRDVALVDCTDLGDGHDADIPAELPAGHTAPVEEGR